MARRVIVALSCSGVLVALPAIAQQAPGSQPVETQSAPAAPPAAATPSAAAASASPDNDAQSGDIVVTAQRRSELGRDVPISITTISADTLTRSGASQLGDIARVTPGLRFDAAGSFAQPTIRGVGTAITTSGGGPNVGIYVDGFFSANPEVADFQLLNVQSIQVLKGPQGTLFGRNTTGGAILVTTTEPSTTTSVQGTVSYGRFDAFKAQAYATTGLTDRVALDLGGVYGRGNGFITNIYTKDPRYGRYEDWQVRTGLKVDLTDSVSVLLRYTHASTNDPTPVLANARIDTDGSAGFFKLLTPAGQAFYGTNSSQGHALIYYYLPPTTYTTNPDQVDTPARLLFRNKTDSVQGTVKADLGFADLTSYTQWRRDDGANQQSLDPDSLAFFVIGIGIRDRTFSQEFVLNSKKSSRLQWTVGANYFQYRDGYNITGSFSGAPFIKFGNSSTFTKSTAIFGDATYELTPKLFLTAGARYSHDEVTDAYFDLTPGQQSYADINGNAVSTAGLPAGAQIPVQDLNNNSVTPRVVARYKPSTDSSIYASYTRGFKAGLLNVGGSSKQPIKPETIDAFETGYKNETRRYAIDLAAFYYRYQNLQVSSFVGGQAQIRNAAQSRIYGFEASGRYSLSSRFDVTAGAAYTHARYSSFKNAPYYSFCDPTVAQTDSRACTPPALGGFGPGGIVQTTVDASGFHMLRSPDFTGNVGANYHLPLAGGQFTFSGNLYYTSSFYFDSAQQFRQNGYATLGLRAQWQDPSRRFTVAAFGDNVTDARYVAAINQQTLGIGNVWNTPATWGVSLGTKF